MTKNTNKKLGGQLQIITQLLLERKTKVSQVEQLENKEALNKKNIVTTHQNNLFCLNSFNSNIVDNSTIVFTL